MENKKEDFSLEGLHLYRTTKGFGKDEEVVYRGSIKFKNSNGDSFECTFTDNETDYFLKPIKSAVIRQATALGKRIADSLKARN